MAYRTESNAIEIVIIDERGKEIASLELISEATVEIDHTMIDITTDDEPDGVYVLMIKPPE